MEVLEALGGQPMARDPDRRVSIAPAAPQTTRSFSDSTLGAADALPPPVTVLPADACAGLPHLGARRARRAGRVLRHARVQSARGTRASGAVDRLRARCRARGGAAHPRAVVGRYYILLVLTQ